MEKYYEVDETYLYSMCHIYLLFFLKKSETDSQKIWDSSPPMGEGHAVVYYTYIVILGKIGDWRKSPWTFPPPIFGCAF